MRIAVFSDVHSNVHALRVVLEDIDRRQPDRIYCLGDLVGYGAYPNEVIEIIRSRGIPTIMGNYDDGVGHDKDDCGCAYTDPEMRRLGEVSLAWTKEQVIPDNKAFLRTLVPSIQVEAEGKRILLVHGSPRRINEYLYEDRQVSGLERIAKSVKSDALLFGHTHLPYIKEIAGVLFVNVGSVGKPKDGDTRAAYALLEVEAQIKATIQRIPYDVGAAAAAVRASGLPPHFAEQLETASG
jgi:putative phosphoesterase